MRLSVVVCLVFSSFSLNAMDDTESNKIQQRVQPIGQVHVQVEKDAASQKMVDSKAVVEVKKEDGKDVYEKHCIVCHRDGLAGAPKVQDERDWKPRLAGRTIQDLVASSIKGLNAMPAKGTCIECTDKDLEAAIHYMLPKL